MGQLDFEYGYNTADYGTSDPPTYQQACMGMMVCPYCGKAAICGNVEDRFKPPQGDQPVDMSQHYDKDAKSGGGKYKRRPFLKAKDIPKTGTQAKILDFREAPAAMEYSDFLMDLKVGSKEFTWGLKSKSVTMNMIIDALGKRTEKWIGKTIKLVTAGTKGQYVNLG